MAGQYDTFFEQYEAQRKQGEEMRLRAAFTLADDGTSPDDIGRVRQAARALGRPTAVGEALPAETLKSASVQQIERHTADAPTLRQRYTDADFMKLARDDSFNLSQIEGAIRNFGRQPQRSDEAAFEAAREQGRAVSGRVGESYRRPSGNMRADERSAAAGVVEPIRRGFAQADRGMTMILSEMGVLTNRSNLGVRLAEQQREVERFPMPPAIEQGLHAITGAPTVAAAFREILRHPRAVLEVSLQSLGASAPALTAAAAGSIGGPLGTAAGAGMGSFAVEYSSTLQEVLEERGVDPRDPLALSNALGNPEVMSGARDKALRRGIPVAFFDAVTGGLAGRLLAGAKPTMRSVGARSIGELGIQAAGGAAGEGVAQAATGEYRPGSILLEAVAEMPSAAIEVPLNLRHARQRPEAVAFDIPAAGGSLAALRAVR